MTVWLRLEKFVWCVRKCKETTMVVTQFPNDVHLRKKDINNTRTTFCFAASGFDEIFSDLLYMIIIVFKRAFE